LSKADPDTGKITDGARTEFRCFSASNEAVFSNVRNARWHNYQALLTAKTAKAMSALLIDGLADTVTRKTKAVRIHVSGDFFNQDYFDAWLLAAQNFPDTKFYAYTKSLNLWVARLNMLPPNFTLIASFGGRHDQLIAKFSLPSAVVVYHPEEAEALGLQIDHDDSHAQAGRTFALLVHGTQPKGSKASEALKRMDLEGVTYSYPAKEAVPV
jgi:hypothetical protein